MHKLLIFLVMFGLAFFSVGFFLPAEIHVERSMVINRPAATVFTLLNSYHSFNHWSPWADLDPNAEFVITGPEQGVGAHLSWSGEPALLGTGWQTITESVPYSHIAIDLDMGVQGKASSYFNIRGDQLGSELTWGFDTDVTEGAGFFGGLMGRYFGLFFDRWIGRDYEQGLAAFKQYAEALPAQDFASLEVEILDLDGEDALLVTGRSSDDPADFARALAQAFGEVMTEVRRLGITETGQPMAISYNWGSADFQFEAAIPIIPNGSEPLGKVRLGKTPAGRAARVVHIGPYDQTNLSYSRLSAFLAAHGYKETGLFWEHYISDPGVTPEAEIITHLYYQLED